MGEIVHVKIVLIVAERVWEKDNMRTVESQRMMWDLLSISSPATKNPKKTKAWSRTAVSWRRNVNGSDAAYDYSCARNCDPTHGLPNLEGEGQTIDCGDDPQMDGVRERNGRSQDTLETSQRVGEGEQRV